VTSPTNYSSSASPINGTFDLYLDVTGADIGLTATDIGITYELTSNPGNAFSISTIPVNSQPGGVFFGTTNLSFAGSSATQAFLGNTGNQALAASNFLGRFAFTIAPNASGTFTLSEYQPGITSQLVLSGGSQPAFTVSPASIVVGTITAVPEPATAGMIGMALVGVVATARKRFSRRK
jgi:hypothetical protein